MKKLFIFVLLISFLTMAGGSWILGSMGEKIAVPSQSSFVLDGVPVAVDGAFNIEGSNYAQLRAISKMLSGTKSQFDIYWDSELSQTVIVTGRPYTGSKSVIEESPVVKKDSYNLGEAIPLTGVTLTVTNAYITGSSFQIGDGIWDTNATNAFYIVEMEIDSDKVYSGDDFLGRGYYINNGKSGSYSSGSSRFAGYSNVSVGHNDKVISAYIFPNTAQMEYIQIVDPVTGEKVDVFVN